MSHYASMIATKAHDNLAAAFGTRFRTYRKTPMLQVNPGDLPLLGVYILREQRTPMGNANHAEPKFKHSLTLGFSGAVHADTDDQNKLYQLEETMSEVDDILLTDPKFVNLTEGITAMDRQSQYAKVGETTLFEIRVEMQVEFSGWFPPVVLDDFDTLRVTLQYPPDVDPATVLQIIRIYEINAAAGRKGNGAGHAR
ncbi:MAG TPA: hypothetical protein VGR63_19235 [Casimicrobiaceae bacterium]|jgi:hypothetical protein|nr:hypothetical protein [Casimicrobiaceae bacterium]